MTGGGRRHLSVGIERFPIAGAFAISRGSRTEAVVVTATIRDGQLVGRGECVPYARYGETVDGVAALVASMSEPVSRGLDRAGLQPAMKAGAARNALDCALWDLEAKIAGRRVFDLAGIPRPQPVITAYTLSLGAPDEMGRAAAAEAHRPLLKVKLGGEGDIARIRSVRAGAPNARLIVDANEAWRPDMLEPHLAACAEAGVELVEQPLPAGEDRALERIVRLVPVCADESVHDRKTIADLGDRYDAINIKLDKTGGLTEALAMARDAEELDLSVMVGCMVGTSLAMAPAMMLAPYAKWIDLDGPLLLAKDRAGGLRYEGSVVHPPSAQLWG